MTQTGLALAGDLALPIEAVTETFAILAKRGAGKTYTGAVLAEELISAGQPVVVIDPVGVWWGLRSSADGDGPGLPVVILGGDHADLPLPADAGTAIADLVVDERIPVVLDLSHLSKSKGRAFVAAFMEQLYHRNRAPLHVIVDEADLFAPQRGGADTARLVGAYEDLVRRGRARGLGCTSITQRPASLHKDILTQSEVLIALRMTGVRDVAAINEWVQLHADDDEAREVKASLAALPVGTAWVWSPGWLGILQRVQIRRRRTFDSSATPKPGQDRVAPREFAAVDLDRLRDRLATADEPTPGRAGDAALRRRVAELEHELAAARAAVRTVEVPAIAAGDVDRLAAVAQELAEVAASITAAIGRVRQPQPAAVAVPAPLPRPRREPTVPPAAAAARDDGERKLSRAERAILTVLAQHGERTVVQVAILAGYSHTSGGYRNALSSLRSAGYIAGRGTVEATTEGVAALGEWEPLPSGPALVGWWYERLGKAERSILAAVLATWPDPMPVDEIAAATGYSATSGGFRNALSKLRTLQLAEGRGELRAADTLALALAMKE